MRTRTEAQQVVLRHLAGLPMLFDPSSCVARESDEKLLNWAARIRGEC